MSTFLTPVMNWYALTQKLGPEADEADDWQSAEVRTGAHHLPVGEVDDQVVAAAFDDGSIGGRRTEGLRPQSAERVG